MNERDTSNIKLRFDISVDINTDKLRTSSDKELAIMVLKAELKKLEADNFENITINHEDLICDILIHNPTPYNINNDHARSTYVMNEIAKVLKEKTKNMVFDFNRPQPEEVSFRVEGYEFKYHLSHKDNIYTLDSITRIEED